MALDLAGGGSGGSVNIVAGTLTGDGVIQAIGGNGRVYCGTSGSGGGGRIVLGYATNTYTGSTSAAAGTGGSVGAAGTVSTFGMPSINTLTQYKADGITAISTGDNTDETSVAVKMNIEDTDNPDILTPEFEVREIGTDFTDTATDTGTPVAYSGSAVTGEATVTGLSDVTNYHWQGRVCDASDNCSSWTSYGGNGEGATDFGIVLNTAPSSPSSLGVASFVDGSWGSDNTPTLSFTISDPDDSDQVKYTIQIDDSADFGSAVVEYVSAFAAEGARTFTVGQAAGGGSYTTGSEGQTLLDESYYWRVKAADDDAAESSYSTANSGEIAFKIGTDAPGISLTAISPDPTTDTTPAIAGTAIDTTGTVSSVEFQVDATAGSWSACVADDGTFDEATETFTCTISSALDDGDHTIYVRATDNASNTTTAGSETSDTFNVSYDIQVTESDSSTDISESGDTDTISVVLLTQPASDVLVTLSAAAGQVDISPSVLTFTGANYPIEQEVTLSTTHDETVEDAHTDTIAFSVTSDDTNYDGMSVGAVTVNITDHDYGDRIDDGNESKIEIDIEEINGNAEGDFEESSEDSNKAIIGTSKLELTFKRVDYEVSIDSYELRLQETDELGRPKGPFRKWISDIDHKPKNHDEKLKRAGYSITYSGKTLRIKVNDGEHELDDGIYFLKIRAYDYAGNYTDSDKIKLVVDTMGGFAGHGADSSVSLDYMGTIEVESEKYQTYYYTENHVKFVGRSLGASQIEIDGATYDTSYSEGTWTYSTTLSNGEHSLNVGGVDFVLIMDPTGESFPASLQEVLGISTHIEDTPDIWEADNEENVLQEEIPNADAVADDTADIHEQDVLQEESSPNILQKFWNWVSF
jgi:hypothetical protein